MRQGWVAVTPISPYAQNKLALDISDRIIGWPVFSKSSASL
jgi:hypothetical protein